MDSVPPPLPPDPPASSSTMRADGLSDADASHLQLLAIFHYILAGLTFLLGLIPIAYAVFGLMLLTNQEFSGPNYAELEWQVHQEHEKMQEEVLFGGEAPQEPIAVEAVPGQEFEIEPEAVPPPGMHRDAKVVGGIVIGVSALLALVTWLTAGLMLLTGRSLQKRKRYALCMVTAAISLLQFPFGTTLGIFTIIVLQRPGIVAAFKRGKVA